MDTSKGNLNVYNAIRQECDNRGIEILTNHRVNTGNYGKGKHLIVDEFLGGVLVLPKQMSLRMTFLQKALNDIPDTDNTKLRLPSDRLQVEDTCKLIILPELHILELIDSCCNVIVDWARGDKCLVLPREDSPELLLTNMLGVGDNFIVLPVGIDETTLIKNAKEVLCSTVSKASLIADLNGIPFSFMKEGRPHDVGVFRLLNILLANDISTRKQRLVNFINSKYSGLFLPGRDGPTELRNYLEYYEENYEKSTYSHSA